MRVTIALLALLAAVEAKIIQQRIGIPPDQEPHLRAVRPEWGEIEQRLDHFDDAEERTWMMRYMNNSQFFQPGGPIFIFIGGEWEVTPGNLQSGQMFDMASEHNGYMFYTEHRYYGQSYPTEDFSTANLKYLSSEQALADLAHFIRHQKKTSPELKRSKVVVVGGSYSATLATWARLKYPDLIDAALSSSAPLLAIEDFYQYMEVVSKHVGLASDICEKTILTASTQIEESLLTSGRERVEEIFNTCDSISTDEPYRSYFFSSIAGFFAGTVQYASNGSIARECDEIASYNGTAMEKLGAYIRTKYGDDCMGGYDDFVEHYSKTKLTRDPYRQWLYQTCTEFGFFQTSSSDDQMFRNNFPVEINHAICKDLFGEDFTPQLLHEGIDRTNEMYGALKPDVTQVVSVHGSVDPWHKIGVLKNISSDAPVFVVKGSSHCADLSSISWRDTEQMRNVKETVKNLIGEWINSD